MAGVMLGLRDIYDGPPKDDTIVAIVESPDEPGDIDTDGIEVIGRRCRRVGATADSA